MQKSQKEILIWGAGKIGRGFIADLFFQAGYSLCFVDVDHGMVDLLRKRQEYTVALLPDEEHQEEHVITGYEVLHAEQRSQILEKIAATSLIAVAVFPAMFEEVAKELAQGIENKAREAQETGTPAPLNILICTNILHPAQLFQKALEQQLSDAGQAYLKEQVGLIETLMIRMAVEPSADMKARDPLIVMTNGYPEMPLDKTALKDEFSPIPGMVLCDNFAAEETRKLYTYNMIHAVYAYLGHAKGYEYVVQCIADPEIQQIAVQCLEETSLALQAEYGYSEADMRTWNDRVLKNMANPILKDRVDRVGADPVRKLQRHDRLTGPALLCQKHGMLPYYLATAIAHAFVFTHADDTASQRIQEAIASTSIREAVARYCQLDREVELIRLIAQQYQRRGQEASIVLPADHVEQIKRAYRLGFEFEKTYKGCAQCTLAAMFQIIGKEEPLLFQAASGFSAGIGLCGDGVCGGYSGGVMCMSSLVGRRLEFFDNDNDAKYTSFDMAQRLHDRFLDTYGSVLCRGVHQAIFGKAYCLRESKAVRDEFEEVGAHTVKCTTVVATASQWVTELLLEENLL